MANKTGRGIPGKKQGNAGQNEPDGRRNGRIYGAIQRETSQTLSPIRRCDKNQSIYQTNYQPRYKKKRMRRSLRNKIKNLKIVL